MKNYYKILGVSKSASQDEIKRAFHKLAHQHHPNKGGDEKKFKEINEAYQVLSNKEKRKQYDQFGSTEGPNPNNWAWGSSGMPNMEFDLEDLEGIFSDFFGREQSSKKNIKKGKNIQIDIELSLEDIVKDINKKISLNKYVVCSRCQGKGAEPGAKLNECVSCRGTGEVQEIKRTFLGSFTKWSVCPECGGAGQKPEKACNVCRGEGRIREKEEIEIHIPAGVDSRQIIKIHGKGEAGKKGGEPGDLYIRILIKKHPKFERRGDDLILSVPITFSQAVLGDKITLNDIEGNKFSEKISPGTKSGDIIKSKSRGIPHFSGFGRGDLYIQLILDTPKKLSKKQKELLKKLKEEGL